jgi:5-methylcytosine-specific restriction protein A
MYCELHAPLHRVKETPDRAAVVRGYDSRWNKARLAFLAAHPLCEACKRRGVYTRATVVDHIVPHRGDQALFWDESNWQALCKPCHDKKTGEEDRYVAYHY